MRLVVALCEDCQQVTDAHHAHTLDDIENAGEFIRKLRRTNRKLELLEYRHDSPMLQWCQCSTTASSRSV